MATSTSQGTLFALGARLVTLLHWVHLQSSPRGGLNFPIWPQGIRNAHEVCQFVAFVLTPNFITW